CRAHQIAAGRVAMVAALAHRNVQAERDGIGERQFHLAVIAARAEDAQVWNHALPRADDRYHLIGGEEPVLIEPLMRLELMTFAEGPLWIFGGHWELRGGIVDDGRIGAPLPVGGSRRGRPALRQRLPHQPLYQSAIQSCRAHDVFSRNYRRDR